METSRVLIRSAPAYEQDVLLGDGPDISAAPLSRLPRRPPTRYSAGAARDVRAMAVRTITLILEVLDRRRTCAQLDLLVVAAVSEQIANLIQARGLPRGCSSTLRRVHVQMAGPAAAELFGTLATGARTRAFAGRVEYRPCRVRPPGPFRPGAPRVVEYRWQLVDFTII